MTLTAGERKQFVERGYVVRQLRLDPVAVARAIDLTWEHMDPRFQRDAPDTWRGEVQDSCRVETIEKRRGRVKLRECVNRTPWLTEMIYGHPEVQAVIGCRGPCSSSRRGRSRPRARWSSEHRAQPLGALEA